MIRDARDRTYRIASSPRGRKRAASPSRGAGRPLLQRAGRLAAGILALLIWLPSQAPRLKPLLTKCKSFLASRFAQLSPHLRRPGPLRAALIALAVLLCAVPPIIAANASGASSRGSAAIAEQTPVVATASPAPQAPSPTPVPTPAPDPTPTPPPHPENTVLRQGVSAPVVAQIQERLMDLGYMEHDEPTEYFGPVTEQALLLFQRQHGLDEDGRLGAETYAVLMGRDAQNYTVMLGARGVDVTELQGRLRELGYMDEVTGFFGELTEQAVRVFQQYNNLTVDGKVGRRTRELLYSTQAKAYFLKYGERSDEVETYQKYLKKLGYLTTTPDGVYGKDTVAAVRRFQELNGLIADGFLGPKTVNLLKSGSARANALVFGMSGDDVRNMQTRLKNLGYMRNVTGYFGSETESAVKAFQKRNGLSVDGTVGRQTMAKLTSSDAKKAAAGSSGGTGSSSSTSSSAADGRIENFLSIAQSKLGCPYVWGAKGSNSFDCSGFVYYCLNRAGVNQGYMTSEAWSQSTKYRKITRTSDLKRGDILVFRGHVAIYMGNGRMIDASSGRGQVVTRSGIWSSSYWNSRFICGFRIF